MSTAATRVVIIEDEFFMAEDLRNLIGQLGYWVTGVYHSGEQFLEETKWDFDIAVVDIFLSENLSGLDLAEHMNQRNRPFIFLTANQDARTVKLAAHLMPRAYLSKPFRVNDVAAALTMVTHSNTPRMEVRGSGGRETINPNDICYIKSDGAYVELYMLDGKYVLRKLLKEILEELPSNFVQVHRSYAINTNHIESKTARAVKVANEEIPVSRSFRAQFD